MSDGNIYVIIVAGGSGKRMSSSLPKQFINIAGAPVIVHTIREFDNALSDYNLIVVMNPEWIKFWENEAKKFEVREHQLIEGGVERFFSVKNAIFSIKEIKCNDIVLVHDAVRPIVDEEIIKNVVEQTKSEGCSIPVVSISQSLRKKQDGSFISVDRNEYIFVQTPQGFNLKRLKDAYEVDYNKSFTDDASVFEAAGNRIFYTRGKNTNIKITYSEDIHLAECLLDR
jgi:2-C-methyl-D-erythritol 4-phosphate cytidylyltransferase